MRSVDFANRVHSFAAAEAMRRILIDRARRRMAQRHGGDAAHVELEDDHLQIPQPDEQILAVQECLEEMKQLYPRQAELVKLRYFAVMTIEETAELLGVSLSTAKNDWLFARTWLFRQIGSP